MKVLATIGLYLISICSVIGQEDTSNSSVYSGIMFEVIDVANPAINQSLAEEGYPTLEESLIAFSTYFKTVNSDSRWDSSLKLSAFVHGSERNATKAISHWGLGVNGSFIYNLLKSDRYFIDLNADFGFNYFRLSLASANSLSGSLPELAAADYQEVSATSFGTNSAVGLQTGIRFPVYSTMVEVMLHGGYRVGQDSEYELIPGVSANTDISTSGPFLGVGFAFSSIYNEE